MRVEVQPTGRDERGAILIIALALLGLLATLAILALQAAAYDWQLSGSERFRLRALAAAEACMATLTAALLRSPPGALPPDMSEAPVPDFPEDRMQCQVRDIGIDAAIPVRSAGALSGRHYTVLASGRSARAASAALEQGVLVVRDAAGAIAHVERSYWLRLEAD